MNWILLKCLYLGDVWKDLVETWQGGAVFDGEFFSRHFEIFGQVNPGGQVKKLFLGVRIKINFYEIWHVEKIHMGADFCLINFFTGQVFSRYGAKLIF